MTISLRRRILRYLRLRERFETNTEIAHALKAPPSQVSSITNRLAKAGVIKRTNAIPYRHYIGPWL